MSIVSRRALAGLAFAALALGACSQAADASSGGGKPASRWEVAGDFVMGSPSAKVVLIEYASVTCPHCAHFHTNVLPTIKQRYVDTGKVRYVFRAFPTPPVNLSMAGHLLSRCVPRDRHFQVIDTLMRQQNQIIQAAQGPTGARQAMLGIAASAGLSEQQFDACMANQQQITAIRQVIDDGQKQYDITGTPTIIINGEVIRDASAQTTDGLARLLDARLKG
jgi:protein-disulfide isomerase